jgi:hypothetical protein
MEKKLLVVLVVVGLCSTAALALDPMGPATAGLKQGQFSAGLDYAYSQMELKHDGSYSWDVDYGSYTDTVPLKYKHEDTQMHKAYFNLGYGVADWLEAFLRLGGANLYGKRTPRYSEGVDGPDTWLDETIYDSSTGFAYGFGGKATVWEPSPELKVGVLAQASWANVDYDIWFTGVDDLGNLWGVQSPGQLDFWEVQIALGVTYQLAPKFSVYGGPFYYWFSGDFDHKGSGMYDPENLDYDMAIKGSYDVEDVGCFGGYLGAQIAVTDNIAWNAECQGAKGALALGTSLVWKF